MITIRSNNFNEAYSHVIDMVMRAGDETPSRITTTKELHPCILEVEKPSQHLVTAWNRPVNVAFALAEVLWILGGRKDVEMLEFYNSQISQYSDDGQEFNASYGYRLRKHFGLDQIAHAAHTLSIDPDSRQVTLVIADPYPDRSWNADLLTKHETKDRACNVLAHVMIRNGQLDWLQIVRSNDAMWGTPYNWMQFSHLQRYIASMLNIPVGNYVHVVDSMHIYEYHWGEAERVRHFNLYSVLGVESHKSMPTGQKMLSEVMEVEEAIRTDVTQGHRLPEHGGYWNDVLLALAAHAWYKRGEDHNAGAVAMMGDPVYAAAQHRFYYDKRWHKDDAMKKQLAEWYETRPNILQWVTTRTESAE